MRERMFDIRTLNFVRIFEGETPHIKLLQHVAVYNQDGIGRV